MLSFEEFQEYVKDHIREYLPEEFANAEVSIRTVKKLNGVTLQGLEIWTPEIKQSTGVTPTIYLDGKYENYENGVELEVIMEHIGNLERQSMDLPEDVAEIKERYKDVNYVKDRLIVSLINAERNVDILKDRPHRMLEDLAIVYKVLVNKDETGTGTIPVTNSHMEYWGLTEEQLYETAIKNSNMFEPPFMINLSVGGVFMFCLNCAKQIGDITKNRICPYCGYEQYKLEDVQAGIEYAKRKSKENRNGGFSEEEILALGLYPKDEAYKMSLISRILGKR